MTGWNMPPGCNVSDIPGNRPEDLKVEAFEEALSEIMAKYNLPVEGEAFDALSEWIQNALAAEFNSGYNEGTADTRHEISEKGLVMIIVIAWAILSYAVGLAAENRYGRSKKNWFVLALLISPLCAFALLWASGPLSEESQHHKSKGFFDDFKRLWWPNTHGRD